MKTMKRAAPLLVALAVGACRATGEPSVRRPSSAPSPTATAPSAARMEPSGQGDAGVAWSFTPPTAPSPRPTPTLMSFSVTNMPDATWVLAAHPARGFQRVALQGTGVVHLAWTRDEPQDDPRSSMPVARTELLLTRDGHAARVDLGEAAGSIEPASTTVCARLGFRTAEGKALGLPRIEGLVSALSVGAASGSDEILVLLGGCAGGCALEVLRSRTSDGMCEAQAKQGPLTVCHGEEYERVAEVHLVPPASFDESVQVTTTGEAGTTTAPLDCAGPTLTGSLLPPVGAATGIRLGNTQPL